jgi:hypothetical protein
MLQAADSPLAPKQTDAIRCKWCCLSPAPAHLVCSCHRRTVQRELQGENRNDCHHRDYAI